MTIVDRVRAAAQAAQSAARSSLRLPGLLGEAVSIGITSGAPDEGPRGASPWAPAPMLGADDFNAYRSAFEQAALMPKAWKNLFFVQIKELRPSGLAPGGADGFNLFVVDLSWAPITMPGDAIAVGGANLDHLNSAERVELRMTTFDDESGSVKRWFEGKAEQASHKDGTFGLPVEYLVTVDITHMKTMQPGAAGLHARQKFLMRPSSMENELSRQAPELETVMLAFTQFDTFMKEP